METAPSVVTLKLSFRGASRRLTVPNDQLTLDELHRIILTSYPKQTGPPPASYSIIYRDEENDLVTVSTPEELIEARRVALEVLPDGLSGKDPVLHLHIVPHATLKDHLSPILRTLDQISGRIVHMAAATRESIRRRPLRESLSSSAVHTKDVLASAGRRLSRRLRSASASAVGEMASLRERMHRRSRSRVSSQDSADASAQPCVLSPLMAVRVSEDGQQQEEEAPESPFSLEKLMMLGKAASPADEGPDKDWALVTAPTGELIVDSDDDVDAMFEPEDAESRCWAPELSALRDVVPGLRTPRGVELLQANHGDVDAVLLELLAQS
ncbi:hypothetical protein ATCC90586_008075 [Pythium insidiosum]|nr:hypothetical protein ATCC90586_008075 [Pythium insidiosum]